jgi:hypothetical protein
VFYQNAQAIAGVITIETGTSVTVTGDLLKTSVTTENKGDEPAYNVQVHLTLLDERESGPVKARIDKGQKEKVTFEKTFSEFKKGRYPLVVMVDFYDANQYPFSAVSCTTFFLKEDANSDLVCLGKNISIKESGRLEFKIRNPGSGFKSVRTRLILPKELSTPVSQTDLRLDAGEEKTINFDIKNFSALSEASYPVFCLLEYDFKDTHFTSVARSIVTIKKDENWFSSTKKYWIGVAFLLALIMVSLQLKTRKSRQ